MPRADAPGDPPRGRRGRRRGRAGGARRLGGASARHLRGRGARAPLRPDRLRGARAAALCRPPLGPRRGGCAARRELAGPRRPPLLHGDPSRPAGRDAPSPLPDAGPEAARHRRRVTRRNHARRRARQRLPPRGARAEPRHADAGHRRDDPGGPVPAHHARPRPAARRPGWPGHGQDRRGAPPRLVAPLHGAGARRAEPRARRRPEPDVHGVRLARPPGARRGRGGAARRAGPRRRRRAREDRRGGRRAPQGRCQDGRRPGTGGVASSRGRARRAAAAARRRLRPGPGPRAEGAPRRDAGRTRDDGAGARAVPHGDRAELLRGVRPPAAGRGGARCGGGRAGSSQERRASPRPGPCLARGEAGQARAVALLDSPVPRRGGGRDPHAARAAAPASARCGLERRGRPAPRRGARARRRAAPHVRPRHRRRGAGPLADGAAEHRTACPWVGRHPPRRHRPGHRALSPTRAGRR